MSKRVVTVQRGETSSVVPLSTPGSVSPSTPDDRVVEVIVPGRRGPQGNTGPQGEQGPQGIMEDATATNKGAIALAHELAGTADAPELADPPVTLTLLFENSLI